MKTELSVEIDCPIDRVFDYTCDNAPKWSESVVLDELVESKNDGGAGTTFRLVTEERGKQMEFQGEVMTRSPPTETRIMLRGDCLLYTSPSPRDATLSRMPSSA